MKKLAQITVIALLAIISGCTKEVVGPTGPTGATGSQGAATHKYDFNLDFNASTTSALYQLPTGSLSGHTAIVYMDNGSSNWTTLPYTNAAPGKIQICFAAEINETAESITIKTTRADGSTGSPWTSTVTLKFKVVIID